MKILKWLIVGILGLAAVLAVVGLVLPRQVRVQRTATVARPPAQVYALMNNMKRFNEWSPWAKLDPKTEYTFSGPDSGVGAKLEWKSDDPNVGKGMQVITSSTPESVKLDLEFGGQGNSKVEYAFQPDGTGTRVTWTMDSDLGNNPIGRWFGLMMDGMVGPDFERGLASLKSVVEKEPSL